MILDSCSADEVLLISSTISVSLCWAPHVLRWPSLLLWVPSPMVTSLWHGCWNPDFSVHHALEMIQQSLLPITPNKGSREVSQRQLSLSFSLWFSVGLFWFPSASNDTSVKVAQLFLTLCDPMDCSLPGSSVSITIQISIILFEEIKNKNSKTQIESQGTAASQNNLKKEQSWRPHTSWFQYILQSNSNQNSAMLA